MASPMTQTQTDSQPQRAAPPQSGVRPHTTVPGLDPKISASVQDALHSRLVGLIDLQLTLKHVHWNVVGPDFIAVHEMLDDHTDHVRAMTDAIAERVRTLGGEPVGTPGHVVTSRSWTDYPLGRDTVPNHLCALDAVYEGVIADHRGAIAASSDDPITEDLLIGQTAQLELDQWFIRSFVESSTPSSGSAWRINGPATPNGIRNGAERH